MAQEADWIEWVGGKCPVDPDTLVQVKWADPNRPTREPVPAKMWSESPFEWAETKNPFCTIIAYRVVSL